MRTTRNIPSIGIPKRRDPGHGAGPHYRPDRFPGSPGAPRWNFIVVERNDTGPQKAVGVAAGARGPPRHLANDRVHVEISLHS
ncbi:hypothetical protein EVAR_8259_1 [Eumeta japonica]|uniref:Uncharacterized protein n=1 Tax=Eumeta variegata TaxID=151549 RepID=A0A4C1TID8_EUMVA|nr:hypothetical protein EVAR_8259_1 [Eumeta japonica]